MFCGPVSRCAQSVSFTGRSRPQVVCMRRWTAAVCGGLILLCVSQHFLARRRGFLLRDLGAGVLKLREIVVRARAQAQSVRCRPLSQGETMRDIRAKWLTFYGEHVEEACKEIFAYVERMIVATLIISAGGPASSNETANVLFVCFLPWPFCRPAPLVVRLPPPLRF